MKILMLLYSDRTHAIHKPVLESCPVQWPTCRGPPSLDHLGPTELTNNHHNFRLSCWSRFVFFSLAEFPRFISFQAPDLLAFRPLPSAFRTPAARNAWSRVPLSKSDGQATTLHEVHEAAPSLLSIERLVTNLIPIKNTFTSTAPPCCRLISPLHPR